MKRLLPLYGCSLIVVVLLTYEFSRGLLSPRGLGIGLLLVSVAIGSGAVLIIKKVAKERTSQPGPSGPPTDDATRKLYSRVIRRAKIRIAATGALMVLAIVLPEIRNIPVWALSVALATSLLIMATSVQTVVRLQKALRSSAV